MSRYIIIPQRPARPTIVPRHPARALLIPQRPARAFVTSIVAPTGGATFYILAETGEIINAENSDRLRTE